MGHYYRSRVACDVLEEMRVCCKTLNFGHLLGLIEELQTAFNRMEAGLEQKRDIGNIDKEWTKKKKELRELEKKIQGLSTKEVTVEDLSHMDDKRRGCCI